MWHLDGLTLRPLTAGSGLEVGVTAKGLLALTCQVSPAQ